MGGRCAGWSGRLLRQPVIPGLTRNPLHANRSRQPIVPGLGVRGGGECRLGTPWIPANTAAGMTWGDGALGGADDCFANLSFRARVPPAADLKLGVCWIPARNTMRE